MKKILLVLGFAALIYGGSAVVAKNLETQQTVVSNGQALDYEKLPNTDYCVATTLGAYAILKYDTQRGPDYVFVKASSNRRLKLIEGKCFHYNGPAH